MTIGETVTRAFDAAQAEYENVRREVVQRVGTPLETIRDALKLEEARDKVRSLQGPRGITAARIMAEGPGAYARELTDVFSEDDGLHVKRGSVLCFADGKPRDYWTTAKNVDSRDGGWCDSASVRLLLADHKTDCPKWFDEHRDARGIAFDRDFRAHLFIREQGKWLGGAELTAHRETKRVAAQAARDAEFRRWEEETTARAAEERQRGEELRARFVEEQARLGAELDAAMAKEEEEAEVANERRLEALGNLAADPATVVAIAQCLGLVRDDGTMRALLSEEDLEPFSDGIVISKGATAQIVDAIVAANNRIIEKERVERIMHAVKHEGVRSRGRTFVRANIGNPYSPAIEIAMVAYCDKPESNEASDGASGSLVDRTIRSFGRRSCVGRGRVVLTTVDEVVPLAWRGL
jgi:hypothetical protein